MDKQSSNQQSIQLLEVCSSGCKMAVDSMNQISEYAENEKLAKIIESARQKHCKLDERASMALAARGEGGKEPGKAAVAFAWLTTEMKMMLKSDSREISKIMTNGCNMGIQSLMKAINDNPEADSESSDIAREIVKAEEEFMEHLKPFL